MKGNHIDIHQMTSECQARTLLEICGEIENAP